MTSSADSSPLARNVTRCVDGVTWMDDGAALAPIRNAHAAWCRASSFSTPPREVAARWSHGPRWAAVLQHRDDGRLHNHVPGSVWLTDKARLPQLLAARGLRALAPTTWTWPRHAAAVRARVLRGDPNEWVVKATTHRGVRPLDAQHLPRRTRAAAPVLVQRRVRGTPFANVSSVDLGIYAMLLRDGRTCVHRDVRLVRLARDGAPVRGGRYVTAWDAAASPLAPHARRCRRARAGCALVAALRQAGHDGAATVRRAEDAVLQTAAAAWPRMRRIARAWHLDAARCCFELIRADFLLDADARPWLIEMNASPSMVASCPADASAKAELLRDVFDLLAAASPGAAGPAWRCETTTRGASSARPLPLRSRPLRTAALGGTSAARL